MKLFEPGRIGRLAIKNRIVMAAMGNMLQEMDGGITQRAIDYYVDRAKGGVGLIIMPGAHTRLVEMLPFAPLVDKLVIDSKMYAGRLNELAEAVHDYGAKIAVQFTAGQGRNIRAEVLRSSGAVAPSPLPAFADPSVTARELATEEVERLAHYYQLSAEVVRGAGIDAIEINAHGGYLCDEFLTALWNKRTDKYGGDLDGRLRFLMEIIAYTRKGAGQDFPLLVKFGLTHFLAGGREIDEGLEIARRLEAAGVDALDIDGGCYETLYFCMPPTTQPPGCLVDLAEKVKKVVKVPVITVGRLHYPELAEKVLQEGEADFVALGRGLLAEPEWANKVKEGRLEDIRPCLGDNEGCLGRVFNGKAISCTVNPECGNEREMAISPAGKKKKVLIVGGGPGGMEAAIIAAIRGHKVTLCEKEYTLGGNLVLASVPDFKQDYRNLMNYLTTQVKKLGVAVKLATEVTPALLEEMKPDVVLVATGGTSIIPEIPGINGKNVATAVDVLSGKKKAGESVVVIGGGLVGCETALHLAQKGSKVTIVEILDTVACDMVGVNRMHLIKLLADANIKVLTGTEMLKVTAGGVALANKGGKKSTLPADTVVIACGFKPNDVLFEALKEKAADVYAIGDCVEPRNVYHAIREGFRRARLI